MFPYKITPNSAMGSNDLVNAFAYHNSGKRCAKIGDIYWAETPREQGMRQQVKLEDGTIGAVWEDELDRVCLSCNLVQWECMCEEITTEF